VGLVLPTVGNLQLVQVQCLGQSLLHQSLLREDIGSARGTFLALPWLEQNKLLYLLQLFEELFHRKIAPSGFGLAMHILQQRDAQHTVKRMDADLAVGPVMHQVLPLNCKNFCFLCLRRLS
jgi:hypothetical protein